MAILLNGCGGGGGNLNGQIAGVLFDVNGDVVRDAKVWVDLPGGNDPQTRSNSSGAYLLEGIPEGAHIVRAEVFQNGLRYYGQNVIQVFRGERSKSTNISLIRDTQLASIRGVVMDRFGNVLRGAKIFAIGNGLSSGYAISDTDGTYALGGLQAGLDYLVGASAPGYGNDEDIVNLFPGEQRTLNFALGNATNPTLPAPQNLSAVAWTSPREVTTRGLESSAIDNIKRLCDPRMAQRVGGTRLSQGGNWIEIDLFWTPVSSLQLLGYGIYRGTNATGPLGAEDFLRDIYAEFYADLDDTLLEGVTYYYEVTALNTSYPNTLNSESAPSNRYGVTPIGDLTLRSVASNPLTFRWNTANGGESYSVFVFNRYPRLGVNPIWQSAFTAGTEIAGPSLAPGTYYYVVLGIADGGDSRTISVVDSFVVN